MKSKNLIKNTKGFTLIELIVVMTILSILGTIAFISLQWYASNARDSVRISDISLIKKALELFNIKTSIYPIPSDPLKTVTYSWAITFYEGTFGESAFRQVESINKNLKDPLYESVFYTYSITNNKKQYQIGYITENSTAYIAPIIESTFASSLISQIKGNYSGSILMSTGGISFEYTLPTIITSQSSPGICDIETLSGSFVTDWWDTNIPFSYLEAMPAPPPPPAQIDISFTDYDGIIVTCPDCITYP